MSIITWPLQIERIESCGIAVMLFDVIAELLTQRRFALDERAAWINYSCHESLLLTPCAGALSLVCRVPTSMCAYAGNKMTKAPASSKEEGGRTFWICLVCESVHGWSVRWCLIDDETLYTLYLRTGRRWLYCSCSSIECGGSVDGQLASSRCITNTWLLAPICCLRRCCWLGDKEIIIEFKVYLKNSIY